MTMIARYDATATVLANIFYYVIANPHVYARLQAEVDEHLQSDDVSL